VSPQARYLVWYVRDTLGAEGLVGILLLVVATGIGALGFSTAHELAVQEAALERAKAASPLSDPTPVTRAISVSAALPTRSQIPGVLADLARLAEIAKLDVSTARYEYLPGSATVPPQMEIRFQMQARYGALRSFVAHVANALPAVGLREFTVRRVAPDADDLVAELRFVVVVAEERR
jgi:hypothetical protein